MPDFPSFLGGFVAGVVVTIIALLIYALLAMSAADGRE